MVSRAVYRLTDVVINHRFAHVISRKSHGGLESKRFNCLENIRGTWSALTSKKTISDYSKPNNEEIVAVRTYLKFKAAEIRESQQREFKGFP